MGQRSRKRGRREPPGARPRGGGPTSTETPLKTPVKATAEPSTKPAAGARRSASAQRDAAVRVALVPLAPGERPLSITIGAGIAGIAGAGNLVAYFAGLKIAGKHPAPGGIILFSLLMLVCAVGMWRLRYWAVLGFMGLLAIIVVLFTLLLIEASNLLGFLVPPLIIGGSGWLFLKLVRVLSRIQMPKYPGR